MDPEPGPPLTADTSESSPGLTTTDALDAGSTGSEPLLPPIGPNAAVSCGSDEIPQNPPKDTKQLQENAQNAREQVENEQKTESVDLLAETAAVHESGLDFVLAPLAPQETRASAPETPETPLPSGYRIRQLETLLSTETGSICAVAAHKSNLYIGTTKSQLFHLHLFEDAEEYLLITQLTVGSCGTALVAKILLLPDVELCLVVCNKTLHAYLLPELSPCSVGKIRPVEDILMLSQAENSRVKSKMDKIVVFTATRIRLIQMSADAAKLLKDIPYTGSVCGVSSAAGALANYSNICLVANGTNYDVVDIQQTRRIPLSEFNPNRVVFFDALHVIAPLVVPFYAADKPGNPEEYLLPVCSDAASSMAQFVNAEGEVIRGTLIWRREGYPTGGLAVEWPYVVGLFYNDTDKAMRLCWDSLETLESQYSCEISRVCPGLTAAATVELGFLVYDGELLDLLQLQSCVDRRRVSQIKQYKQTRVALLGGTALYFLDRISAAAEELQCIRNALYEEKTVGASSCTRLKRFAEINVHLWPVYVAVLLLAGQFEEVKVVVRRQHENGRNAARAGQKVDPRLLLLFGDAVPVSGNFWAGFAVPSVVLDLRKHSKPAPAFQRWVIDEIYGNHELYGPEIGAHFRMYMYTAAGRDTAEILELVDSEKDAWTTPNAENDALLDAFMENAQYVAVLHIYGLRQAAGIQMRQWSQLTVELGLALLDGLRQLCAADAAYQCQTASPNVAEVVFQLLRHVDNENYFARSLLQLLQLQPEAGLALLRKNPGGAFQPRIKTILAGLLQLVPLDRLFAALKLEYAEQAFLHALDAQHDYAVHAADLAAELAAHIEVVHFDAAYTALAALFVEFRTAVDLRDSAWPKLTWIEFLHIHGPASTCGELAHAYLRLYEVQVLLSVCSETRLALGRTGDVWRYMELARDKDETHVAFLLDQRDYSAAEWAAAHGSLPLPRTTIYPRQQLAPVVRQPVLATARARKALLQILAHYLLLGDDAARHAAVSHMLGSWGGLFSVQQVLDAVPDELPLWSVGRFLTHAMVALRQEHVDSTARKVLSRRDAKISGQLLREFETALEESAGNK
ncbi:hypothetical protein METBISCDRAFT_26994 [Metschnikowia bicuspidata]|uniref:CNH domain-containing protein n=1 Tax=Metschnikowia bicuspidata TaxID=27322 RepID=A0A4V1J362_9ASCO|nr:hypothetical protein METBISCDRAFT_26994 [Metschnikowia bicuspidata]